MDQPNNPLPILFMPPIDMAHDIYALAIQTKGFDHNLYQDIQHDKAVYDSFQRWPFLFSVALDNNTPPADNIVDPEFETTV